MTGATSKNIQIVCYGGVSVPKKIKGESKKEFASRTISYLVRKEGKSQSQAIAQALSMAGLSKRKKKKKKKKSRRK